MATAVSPRWLGFIAASFAPAILVAVFIGPIKAAVGPAGAVALACLAVIWSFAAILVYWRGLDEVARDAQKTAWLWGGMAGGVIGLIVLGAPTPLQPVIADAIAAATSWLRGGGAEAPRLGAFGLTAVLLGGMYVLIAQTVGFLIFWAGWWIVKR